ncbi:MAG: hypothetical protein CMP59_06305 [Flavobacteriales bacterium]|nr:hypothetical protein [Flavobacteriales bacterium]|tara:strand:- start:853 stop:1563 length:711 start_codon:yes stop_codon:yes gene_type:complete
MPSVLTNKRPHFLAIAFLLLLSSCTEGIFKSGLKEGVIEYKVSYPDLSDDHDMMDLLPKKMQCSFKKGEYRNEITAGMGLFKSAIVYQEGEKRLYHTVKLLNTKIYAELADGDLQSLNEGFLELEFEETGNSKLIAGYECKEVSVVVPGDSSWTFNLFYTDEINIPNFNYRNPFEGLDGVLMEYDILTNNLHMHFEATKVLEKEVDSEEIKISEDYEQVSSKKLREQLESIFDKVR